MIGQVPFTSTSSMSAPNFLGLGTQPCLELLQLGIDDGTLDAGTSKNEEALLTLAVGGGFPGNVSFKFRLVVEILGKSLCTFRAAEILAFFDIDVDHADDVVVDVVMPAKVKCCFFLEVIVQLVVCQTGHTFMAVV